MRSLARIHSRKISIPAASQVSNSEGASVPSLMSSHSWRSPDVLPLTRDGFLSMLHGHTAAIRVPEFVSRHHAQRFEKYLHPLLRPYSHIAGPSVDKVGLAQFEFQAQSAEDFQARGSDAQDRYFTQVAQLTDLHARIAKKTGDNPWERILTMLQELAPEHEVRVAHEPDGRRYHAGIYRSINNSTPIHCDWSPYDSLTEDWVINRVTHQAVLNLYLAPMIDGETILYDRIWEEELLQYRDPTTYGYFREAVDGCATVTLRPSVGDLCLFNTRNLHEVKSTGSEIHPEGGLWQRPRLTLSAFLGLLPAGVLSARPTIILWS
ncbi:hypothetical protein N7481_000018 [Penicillium waksmanii]|uniref:uncharacterized protein n=1 Tax=Penicillium waksmanii TaxID=69791 RepID=UPI00254982E2|nr:uncharacterized protein N7481_000018 [Penicillium waksmanii]KAJ5999609.1 hypothetical protein N7481_000018 [Penicillium waksmanii]